VVENNTHNNPPNFPGFGINRPFRVGNSSRMLDPDLDMLENKYFEHLGCQSIKLLEDTKHRLQTPTRKMTSRELEERILDYSTGSYLNQNTAD
jgi:hypothetical protein